MPATTHVLTITGDTVVKRFVSWDRGEPDREWTALTLLHRVSPGLAPEPLGRRTVDGAPAVVMTRVPGEPLGDVPLTAEQVRALAVAIAALHAAPLEGVDLPERHMGPACALADLRAWVEEPQPDVEPAVREALAAGRAWLGTDAAADLCGPLVERCFTQADGNLANVLWDGERCRIVDFEDSGTSDPAYEVADLLEHISVWPDGLVDPDLLVDALAFDAEQRRRLAGFRRVFALFWLLMLLPGNRAHDRNPPDTLARQARRLQDLLGEDEEGDG